MGGGAAQGLADQIVHDDVVPAPVPDDHSEPGTIGAGAGLELDDDPDDPSAAYRLAGGFGRAAGA
jgi:hypothetical protein